MHKRAKDRRKDRWSQLLSRGETYLFNYSQKVVSFKMDLDLLQEVDRVWKKAGYRSRSDFLREAVIYYAQKVAMEMEAGEAAVELEDELGGSIEEDQGKPRRLAAVGSGA